jgi:hypothetical protein
MRTLKKEISEDPAKYILYRTYRYDIIGTKKTKEAAQAEAKIMRERGMGAVIKKYGSHGRYAIYGLYK